MENDISDSDKHIDMSQKYENSGLQNHDDELDLNDRQKDYDDKGK